jgi:serine/threonine-protein kinase
MPAFDVSELLSSPDDREAPMSSPVRPGEVLAGKYRVERVLGVGGMGVVVAATHLDLGERVALKFLLPEAAERQETVARFLREAQAAVRIRSEHVARISDVGRMPNGSPYMVMEYLSGRDLSEVLEKRGPLPVEVAIEWVLQACEAIAEAHALGIVHRDLKPSNLFLTKRADGSHLVKVLDFGISKAAPTSDRASAPSLTRTDGMMGSPLYMSPEQVRSAKTVDARADVWSLGVLLHELVAGKPPFDGETMTALLAAIVADSPIPLRRAAPHAPPALEAAILRCLEKDTSRRMQSVAELADALLPLAPAQARVSVDRISRVIRGGSASTSFATSSEAPFPLDAEATVDPVRATEALGSQPNSAVRSEGSEPQRKAATQGTWGHTNPDPVMLPMRDSRRTVFGVVAALGVVAAATVGILVARSGSRGEAVASSSALASTQSAPSASAAPPPSADSASSVIVAPVTAPVDSSPSRVGTRPASGGGRTAPHASAAPPAAPPVAPPSKPTAAPTKDYDDRHAY